MSRPSKQKPFKAHKTTAKHTVKQGKPTRFDKDSTYGKQVPSLLWLQEFGLKAQSLTQSEVIKVSALRLEDLRGPLKHTIALVDKRVRWLGSGSRRSFGVLHERKIAIVVDDTFERSHLIKKQLELLIEEQLEGKSKVVFCAAGPEGIVGDLEGDNRVPKPKEFPTRANGDAARAAVAAGSTQGCVVESDLTEMANWVHHYGGNPLHKRGVGAKKAVEHAGSQLKNLVGALGKAVINGAEAIGDTIESIGGSGNVRDAVTRDVDPLEVYNQYAPNVLAAVKRCLQLRDVDAIYVVLGKHPRHTARSLEKMFSKMLMLNATPLVHVVNFDEHEAEAVQCMKMIARVGHGRYMAYTPTPSLAGGAESGGEDEDEESKDLVTGDEMKLIADEGLMARESLSIVERRIRQLKDQVGATASTSESKGGGKGATVSKRKGPAPDVTKSKEAPWSKTNRTQQLREMALKGKPTITPRDDTNRLLATQQNLTKAKIGAATDEGMPNQTSKTWIERNGIEALSLNFYDVFADLCYPTTERENGLYAQYKTMYPITWRDGKVKSMHVEVSRLTQYRLNLLKVVKACNSRIKWLGTGARRVFGNTAGDIVTIGVDMSATVAPNLELIKEHIKVLLSELEYIRGFNVVRFDGEVIDMRDAVTFGRQRYGRDEVVPATVENRNAAWEWIQTWKCGTGKGRNLLGALEGAVANLTADASGHCIYLLCAGRPDHQSEVLLQSSRQILAEGTTKVSTIAYNCHHDPQTVNDLKTIAQIGRGRFHLCLEEGKVFDELHTPGVSWTMPLFQSAAGMHVAEVDADAGTVSDADRMCAVVQALRVGCQEADANASACACDSDDSEMLRKEVDTATSYLQTVDEVLTSLEPDILEAIQQGTPRTSTAAAATSVKSSDAGDEGKGRYESGSVTVVKKKTKPSSSSRLKPTIPRATSVSKSRTAVTKARTTAKKSSSSSSSSSTRSTITKSRRPTSSSASAASSSARHKTRYMAVNAAAPGHNQPSVERAFRYTADPKVNHKPPKKRSELPADEDLINSAEWVREFGLKALGLELKEFLRMNKVSIEPSEKNRGVTPKLWKAYIKQLKAASKRYKERLAWLTAGTRKIFGTILEKNITIAVDTSGSMIETLPFVQRCLGNLINQQVLNHCEKFNLIQFSDSVHAWAALRPNPDDDLGSGSGDDASADNHDRLGSETTPFLVEVSEDTCAAAAAWAQTLSCSGGTNILDAIYSCLVDADTDAIYLLSDGAPDDSTQEILRQVRQLVGERNVKIHTISFNCDPGAKAFLKSLAKVGNGRYHDVVREPRPEDQAYFGTFASEGEPDLDEGGEVYGDDIASLELEVEKAVKLLDRARNHLALAEEVQEERRAALATVKAARRDDRKSTTKPWKSAGATSMTPVAGRVRPLPGKQLRTECKHNGCRNTVQNGPASTVRARAAEPISHAANRGGEEPDSERDDDPVTASESEEGENDLDWVVDGGSSHRKKKPGLKSQLVTKTGLRSQFVDSHDESISNLQKQYLQKFYTANRAFLSNLPLVVEHKGRRRVLEEKDVQTFIKDMSEVHVSLNNIALPWDPVKKQLKGFAYVGCSEPAQLVRVLALNGANFHGNSVAASVAANPVTDTNGPPDIVGRSIAFDT